MVAEDARPRHAEEGAKQAEAEAEAEVNSHLLAALGPAALA